MSESMTGAVKDVIGPDEQKERHGKIVSSAHDFFEKTSKWESTWRLRALDDMRFVEGDAYNNYQWPNSVRRSRESDERPCLTINRARQHCLQIVNDMKQNKPEVRFRPTGGQATYESSQVFEDLARHIMYQSEFAAIHDKAGEHQVKIGFGAYRLTTDWAAPDSFDQEIYIKPIPDPLAVLIDPEARLPDKSDMDAALIFENVDRKVFEQRYPEYKDFVPRWSVGGLSYNDWITQEHVRVAEWYWREYKHEWLYEVPNEAGTDFEVKFQDQVDKELWALLKKDPNIRKRKVNRPYVKYAMIVGDMVAEEGDWPGRYIPIIPVIGEETVIQGQMDRKGHVRALIDPQRMYNYWASGAVEFGALQSKTPWVAPLAAIEGQEAVWATANKKNPAFLPYNHVDDQGNEIPPPQRQQPPQAAPLFLQGMETSQMEMMMVSGQFQSQMGQPGNERSGLAIQERQRQGDNATYHFIDNGAIAIRYLGKQLLDLIPKVYNTKRVLQVLAQDGKTSMPIKIDPDAQAAIIKEGQQDDQIAMTIFNPTVGQYSVTADIGPAFASRRDQAFTTLTTLLTQAPELVSVVGDILMKNADFPGAEEAAQRLSRMVPPEASGKGPTKAEQQMQEQLQTLQQMLAQTIEEKSKLSLKLVGKEEMREIDVYKAETERLAQFLKNNVFTPEQISHMMLQLIRDTSSTDITQVMTQAAQGAQQVAAQPQGQSAGPALQEQGAGPQDQGASAEAPVPGARQAPDGEWYLPDATRPGKYLRVRRKK